MIATVALVVALGGVALATIPDSNGTIHACYGKANGNARLVEAGDRCRSNERSVSWSSSGGGDTRLHTGQDGPKPYGDPVILVDLPGFLLIQLTCEQHPDQRPGEDRIRTTYVLENRQASADLRYLPGIGGEVPAVLDPGESISQTNTPVRNLPVQLGVAADFQALGGGGKAAQGKAFSTFTADTCAGEWQALTNF